MTAFHTVETFGPHQAATHEGFLIVRNVPLARTGPQLYSDKEVPVKGDSQGRVIVMRDEDEVFRPETIASLQGKPLTLDHPDEDVTPENWRDLAVGYVMNPRRGQGQFDNLLLGDLFVTCPKAIAAIRDGSLRELSVGYDASYEDTGFGKGRQTNIIANHLALVDNGRCGPLCRIGDRATIPHGCGRDACTCATRDAAKQPKSAVDYGPATDDRCGACTHYDTGSCELVEGNIDPDAWCKLFAPRETTSDAFEEAKHPREKGGTFAKAHEVAEKHGFEYKGKAEHGGHEYSHQTGAGLTMRYANHLAKHEVRVQPAGVNVHGNKKTPIVKYAIGAESAVRSALKEAGIKPKTADTSEADDDATRTTDPPVSEKQRRAMFAALHGKSTLGIPKSVAKKFVGKSHDSRRRPHIHVHV